MIFFVSDMHFGRSDPAAQRRSETALVACLRAHEDRIDALYLVGDVFDHYIEYASLAPKGVVRFLGLLAEWTDRGVPVTYLVGNHDPWHRDYFETELGVRMVYDDLHEPLMGHHVYLAHGDAASADLHVRLRGLLRHRLPVALYRALLPADAGLRLARWVSRRFADDIADPAIIEALRMHAQKMLVETDADLVIMGHSHHPELLSALGGLYLNTGSWHHTQSFGVLDSDGVRLLRWNGQGTDEIDSVPR